jgi:hypothetical protein
MAKRLDKESFILDPYHKDLNNVQRQSYRECVVMCACTSPSRSMIEL